MKANRSNFQFSILVLGLVFLSSPAIRAQSTPPCAPDPTVLPLFPLTPSPECSCQNQHGSTIACAQVLAFPDMSDCSCPPNGNAGYYWQSGCLRFFTDQNADGVLELVETGANGKLAFAKDPNQSETRYFFADLITPRKTGTPLTNPNYPCDSADLFVCQQTGTSIKLGKEANLLKMKTKLWSGLAQWFHLSGIPGGNPFTSFMSYTPSIPCLKIPRDLAPGKYKIARWFDVNQYCDEEEGCFGVQVPTSKSQYVTVNLAIQGVTAPRIYDFKIDDDAAVNLEKGIPAQASFRLANLGHKNILKSYVVVYASKKENVLSDASKIPVGAAQILAQGETYQLNPANPTANMIGDQGVIDAANIQQDSYSYDVTLQVPKNFPGLEPGKKQDIHFTAKAFIVLAQDNAPEYSLSLFPAEKDTVTLTPDVEIKEVLFVSSTSTQSPPELCYGDSITVKVRYANKGLVPTGPETKMTFLASTNSNGTSSTTLSDAGELLGSIPGKSGSLEKTYTIALWPDKALKLNKQHWLKAKIVKAGLTKDDEPKENNNASPTGSLIPFKFQCPFSPYGLSADIDHDGSFYDDPMLKTSAPGLLVSLDSNDDNQDGILDKNGPYNIADPDLVPLNILMTECKKTGGSWGLEYNPNRLRIFNASGQVVSSTQWYPCSGQLDLVPLKLQGIGTSATAADSSIRLLFLNPQGQVQSVDEILVTVFHLDLTADSNQDGQVSAADEACEDLKGKIPRVLVFNTDDDDHDGIADFKDFFVPGEDLMEPLGFALRPNGLATLLAASSHSQYSLALDVITGTESLAVWKSLSKGVNALTANAISLGELPAILFVEGIDWRQQASTLRARLMDDGIGIGSDKVRFYSSQPGIELVDRVIAGEDDRLPVSVMGFPQGTTLTLQVYKNGNHDFTTNATVDSLLAATYAINMDYDPTHSYSEKPGDKIKVKAVIDDGGCTHFEWWSKECVVKPGPPAIGQIGVQWVGQPTGISNGYGTIPVTVEVKDNYGNPVEDGSLVRFTAMSGDGAKIFESDAISSSVPTYQGKATGYVEAPKTKLADLYVRATCGDGANTIKIDMDWLTGELEPGLPIIHSKGQPLQIRLKNSNALNGTPILWSISSYWGADQDSKKFRQGIINQGQSILTINDTADLLDGLCTITATYGGRFLYTAVYLQPSNPTAPSIVIDKPLLNGEKTQDEAFSLQWTIEKPASWPDIYPPTHIWTLATGTTYAKARGFAQNLSPNAQYLIAVEGSQNQNLLAFYQQPSDLGYAEGFPGIHTDAWGRATFQVVSNGQYNAANFPAEFAPQALGARQVNFVLTDLNGQIIQPSTRNSIKIAHTNTAQRVLGWAGACLGGDSETIEEIGVSVGFGMLPVVDVFQNTGALAKNAASVFGLRDQDADKLETTFAAIGVLTFAFGETPDDLLRAAQKIAREVRDINPDFAIALLRAVDKIVRKKPGALTFTQLGNLIENMGDFGFAGIVLKEIKNEDHLNSLCKAMEAYGYQFVADLKAESEFLLEIADGSYTNVGALSRTCEFINKLPSPVQEILSTPVEPVSHGILGALFLISRERPEQIDDLVDICRETYLFYPSAIDGIPTAYTQANLLNDFGNLIAFGGGHLKPFLNDAVTLLKKHPNMQNRYRIQAIHDLIANGPGLPNAISIRNGKLVRKRWADDFEIGQVYEMGLHLSAEEDWEEVYQHVVLGEALYKIGGSAEDWGLVLGPQIAAELVSKASAEGMDTIRFVIPSLDVIDDTVKQMANELFAQQAIQVIFTVVPMK